MNNKHTDKASRIVADDGRQAERAIAIIFIVNALILLAGIFALLISGGV